VEEGWVLYDQSNFKKAAEVFRGLKPIPAQVLGALCQMIVAKQAVSDAKDDLQYCKEAVAVNDPAGLVSFGLAHIMGNDRLGLPKDKKLGLGYLAESMIANYPVASDMLCNYYYLESEYGQATPFCKVAAASNLAVGLHRLALMSLNGKGAIQDFEKGRNLALLSASLNHVDAYMLLGDISKTGTYGKPKDLVAAYAWFVLAGAAAPDSDKPRQERDALELDQSKVLEAQKMAGNWKIIESQKWRNQYPVVKK
jgi:TPR repeat protein